MKMEGWLFVDIVLSGNNIKKASGFIRRKTNNRMLFIMNLSFLVS